MRMDKKLEIEQLTEAQHLAQFLLEKLRELSKRINDEGWIDDAVIDTSCILRKINKALTNRID